VRAINADGLDVGGEVFLDDGFVANGGVWLRGARIGRQLSCSGGEFNATHDDALNFDGAVVGGDVFLTEGLTVHGEVSLKASTVGGNLACAGSKFLNPSGTALSMDGATVKGDITLNGEFRAEGDVRLNGIRLGGQLVCDRGSFVSGEGHALIAQGAVIEGDVFMRDCFTAEGEVQFLGASIGGQFGCRKGSFRNAGGSALVGDGFQVAGNVFLDLGFEAEGTVFLPALDVGGQLVCNGGTFANEGGMMMVLQGARVGDIFSWKEIGGGSRGHLNLEDARVNVLVDDVASWPKGEDRLILDGFEYGRLAGDAPLEAEKRLEWLERQKQDVVGFKPQPYEQLADVYDRMGHEEHARKVRIANRRAQREYGDLSRGRWLLNWFWDWTIRYGWRTWRAARFGLGLVVFGFFLFWAAGALGGMRATDRDVWNWLQALVYSLDAFLPIVELGPERKFEPNVMAGASGWIAQIYLWVHILAGWIVTTVIGLGITPLVRQK
jgi:hypothetical protein